MRRSFLALVVVGLVVSGFAQESKQVSAADNLPSGRGSVADVRKELVEYVQTAPEFATGIDEKKKRALKAITELCEDKSEDRQTLLRLLLESPRGDLSGFKYPLPNYHPSARVLLWLALAGKLQGSENLCLAMAMSDGLFLWIGDESVQKTLRKDALDMLAFFLKTEQLQQQLGHKRLRTYPPGALVMLAWRGGSLISHSFDSALRPAYVLNELRQKPLSLVEYRTHVLTADVLYRMQTALLAQGSGGQREMVMNGYNYYSTRHWDFIADDQPQLVKFGSQSFPTPSARSASLVFARRQQQGKGIGDCTDQNDVRQAIWKSIGVPSLSVKMVQLRAGAEGQMWGHIIPVFYDADRQAWCGLRTEQREYPYSWAMSVIPIPYGRYLTAQPGFPRCGSRDYGYEMVSGPGQQGGDNEALTSGIPQGVMEKALLADDTGPLGNALVSSSPSAVAASIPASGDPSKQAEQDKAISKIKGIAREVDTAPDGSVISIDFRDTTVSDADLAVLEGFTRLQVLNLNETNITDAGLVHLKGLTRLESLYLRAPNVTDAGLEHLKGLTQLQRLNLDCTGVTNAGLMHLRGLTQLRYLGLGRSKVTDAGMGLLTGFTQLESLNLIGTEVTDAGLKQLQGLPRLRRLTRPDGNRTAAFQ